MKGKRYTTEDKIRILREAESIADICQEANISVVSFHRWKKQFGQMEINEARRLKELDKENTELKKMLAEHLVALWEAVWGWLAGTLWPLRLGLAKDWWLAPLRHSTTLRALFAAGEPRQHPTAARFKCQRIFW